VPSTALAHAADLPIDFPDQGVLAVAEPLPALKDAPGEPLPGGGVHLVPPPERPETYLLQEHPGLEELLDPAGKVPMQPCARS